MTRRKTHVSHDVVYAAVGASAAGDLLRFPPEDSTPFVRELQLGSGAERLLTATTRLMTWEAFSLAGFTVTEIERGDGGRYAGVAFDQDGVPEAAPEEDSHYGPDGTPFLAAGAVVRLQTSPESEARESRVVYVVNEARRTGFALGSADDLGAVGEVAFTIEHRSDDTVWAQARGFLWAPDSGLLGRKGKALVRAAMRDAERVLSTLAPGGVAAGGPAG